MDNMNNEERYVRATNIRKVYDVSYVTLRRWAEDGKIRFKRAEGGGKRLYCINDVRKLYNGGKERESAMQESAELIKKKISNDKSSNSKRTILLMKSSKTLDRDSTGIEKDLQPFWTESSRDLSKRLWLPTKTGC